MFFDCDWSKCKTDITSVIIREFNKKESITKLINAFFIQKQRTIQNNEYLFNIRTSKSSWFERESKFEMFRDSKKICFIIEFRKIRNSKKNLIVIESVNSWLINSNDIRLRIQWITRYVANNVILTKNVQTLQNEIYGL